MALFLRVARMITSLLDFQRTLTSHSMQELNIAYSGRKMLFYTDHIIKAWHELASPFCLTLIDRTDTTHGQVVLQVAIDRGDISFPGNSASSVHEDPSTTLSDQQQALPALQFMHRDCNQNFAQLSDYSASFLDMATLQHPITLTRFTLDISQISRASLASVQNILHRSLLEHVHVVCMDTSRPSPRCCPVAHTQVPGPLWRQHQRLGQPLAFVFGSGPTTAYAPHPSHGESSAGPARYSRYCLKLIAICVLSLLSSMHTLLPSKNKTAKTLKSTVVIFGSLKLLIRTLCHMRGTGLVPHSSALFVPMKSCINAGGCALFLHSFRPV